MGPLLTCRDYCFRMTLLDVEVDSGLRPVIETPSMACSSLPPVGILLDPFHDADIDSGSRARGLCALHALAPVSRCVHAAAAAAVLAGCPLPIPGIVTRASNLLRQRSDQVECRGCERSVQPLIADDCLGKPCNGGQTFGIPQA